MKQNELQLIISEGEGYGIEFKENIDKDFSKELVAFANSSGGKIILGVTDKGYSKGIEITNRLKSVILDIARNCDPPIVPTLSSVGEGILIAEVPEGKHKPYQCKEGFFIRVGATSQKMKREEILKFIISESLVHFDKEINRSFIFNKHFSREKFKRFLEMSAISVKEKNYKIIIKNLGLGTQENGNFHVNNAGILMFAKEDSKIFRQNFVTCVLYKGKDKSKILDRKDFTDDLLSNYYNAITFLKTNLQLEYIIKGTGPRQEAFEIPQEAFREVMLNALIHRDYYDERAGVFVEIFDDRLEVTNKGHLLFDKKYFGKISLPRNPLLFDLFHRLGLIEKVGSGISRIKNACKNSKIKVEFDTGKFFIVTFYRNKATQKTTQKTTQKFTNLTDLENRIINLINKDNRISKKAIAENLKLSPNTIKEYIKKLKKKNVLKRIGPDRGGHWKTN
jgi:ATP-dependent DNA helicase RecG